MERKAAAARVARKARKARHEEDWITLGTGHFRDTNGEVRIVGDKQHTINKMFSRATLDSSKHPKGCKCDKLCLKIGKHLMKHEGKCDAQGCNFLGCKHDTNRGEYTRVLNRGKDTRVFGTGRGEMSTAATAELARLRKFIHQKVHLSPFQQ